MMIGEFIYLCKLYRRIYIGYIWYIYVNNIIDFDTSLYIIYVCDIFFTNKRISGGQRNRCVPISYFNILID